MKKTLLTSLCAILLAPLVSAQAAPQQPPTLSAASTGFNLDWNGVADRVYFIQWSNDLTNWQYMPVIESGASVPLGYGFSINTERLFLRLHYTDVVTNTPNTDDFDGDGISNWDEVRTNGTTTSPFEWDTDGDGTNDYYSDKNNNGLADGWELTYFASTVNVIDPAADPDGDGLTNAEESELNTDPNGHADITDSDGDSLMDSGDAVPGDKVINWEKSTESYAWLPLDGLPSDPGKALKINKHGAVLFSKGVWEAGVWTALNNPENFEVRTINDNGLILGLDSNDAVFWANAAAAPVHVEVGDEQAEYGRTYFSGGLVPNGVALNNNNQLVTFTYVDTELKPVVWTLGDTISYTIQNEIFNDIVGIDDEGHVWGEVANRFYVSGIGVQSEPSFGALYPTAGNRLCIAAGSNTVLTDENGAWKSSHFLTRAWIMSQAGTAIAKETRYWSSPINQLWSNGKYHKIVDLPALENKSFTTAEAVDVNASGSILIEATPVGGAKVIGILPPVDLAVDTDRNGIVERGSDSKDEDKWTKQRGAIYAVNFDRDGDNKSGNENRPDAIHFKSDGSSSDEDWKIEDKDNIGNANTDDEADIAPLIIAEMKGLPKDYKVFLKVEEAEDMRAIHLYKKIEADQTAIWGSHGDPAQAPWAANDDNPADQLIEITKWVNPDAVGYEETRDGSDGDYTFGIEGLVFRGMTVAGGTLGDVTGNALHTGMFSGEIQFAIEIRDKDDNVVGTDISPVRMRVAPWLMISRDQPSEEIWAGDLGQENHLFLNQALEAGNYAGIQHSNQLKKATGGWKWHQDHVEIGFTQRPGGPKTHIVFRVPRGDQPNWPLKTPANPQQDSPLLKKDVGIFQLKNDYGGEDLGGNLETLTITQSNPLGLVMMGDNRSLEMEAFLSAQEFQAKGAGFLTKVKWLQVGHIDECVSFLSGNRVLVSDAHLGIQLLKTQIPQADRAKHLFFATSANTLIGDVTADTAAVDDPATENLNETEVIHTGRNHVTLGDNFGWIRFHGGNAKGHVAKVILHDGFVEIDAGGSLWYTGRSMSEYKNSQSNLPLGDWKIIAGVTSSPKVNDGYTLFVDTKFGKLVQAPHRMPAAITVKEVLEDADFVTFNEELVKNKIDEVKQSILVAAGNPAPQFVHVPALFFGDSELVGSVIQIKEGTAIAFNPGVANLQPVSGSLYVPRQYAPIVNGEDLYEKKITDAVPESVYYVEDWRAYHILHGEVHCGSSVKRALPAWNWWEKINQN